MSTTAVRSRRYKARIKPRSGSRRGSRIQWDKVGRVALVLVLMVIVASYARPVASLFETWQQSKVAEQRLAELKHENQRLQRRADELRTPVAMLREARAQGLVAEGEQPYVVKGLK